MRISTTWPVISSLILIALTLPGRASAQAADTGPTLTETIAYISDKSSDYNVSISADRKNIIFAQKIHGNSRQRCNTNLNAFCATYYEVPFRLASIMRLTKTENTDHTSNVFLNCPVGADECMDRTFWNGNVDKRSSVELGVFDDVEMCNRLIRAVERLISLVGQQFEVESRQKKERDNDPFK